MKKIISFLTLALSAPIAMASEGVSFFAQVKDLQSFRIDPKLVLATFSNEVNLDTDDFLKIEYHMESNVVDFSTLNGVTRRIDFAKAGTPRNLTMANN